MTSSGVVMKLFIRTFVMGIVITFAQIGFADENISETTLSRAKLEADGKMEVFANFERKLGSCGGCVSNPAFCCSDSEGRPVCEDDGLCYCRLDRACQ